VYRELYREHPDALVRGRKGLGLSIDVIRHFVNDQVMLKPVMGRAKVFVVRGAEMMSLAAQNALLKTLEEPPATTFIVLITASTASLLETTRSRCQLASFGLVPRDFIVESLVCHFDGLSEQAAAWYADRAAGSLGAAIRMVEDGLVDFDARAEAVLTAGEGVSVPDLAKALLAEAAELGGKYKERDGDISETEAQRRGIKALLMLMAAQMRERMAAACGDQNVSDAALKAMAEGIRGLATTERQLELNVNPQLCVETGLIRLRRKVSPSAA
jgi:hypothetical protein